MNDDQFNFVSCNVFVMEKMRQTLGAWIEKF